MSNRAERRELITRQPVAFGVFKAGTRAGWVADLGRDLRVQAQVASTNGAAWMWKDVKRKTDRDDALKLAKLAAPGQLPPVRLPDKAVREKRALLSYRQGLVGRRIAVRDRIRAVLLAQGSAAPCGHRAWTHLGLDGLARFARPLAECPVEELWRGELDLALSELRQIVALLDQVEGKLDTSAKSDPAVPLLQAIPGVDPRTAEAAAAYLDQAPALRRRPAGVGLRRPGAAAASVGGERPAGPRHPSRPRAAPQDAGRARLGHAALQRLGSAAGRAHQQGPAHARETGRGGAGAEALGADVGDAAGWDTPACRRRRDRSATFVRGVAVRDQPASARSLVYPPVPSPRRPRRSVTKGRRLQMTEPGTSSPSGAGARARKLE